MKREGIMKESIEQKIKESDDEKIRTHLIVLFKREFGENSNVRFAGIKVKDIIVWLEKQGEQKPADEIKPKFKHGNRVRNKKSGLEQTLGSCIENVYEGAFPFRIKDQDDWEIVEQRPDWSEEDELHLRELESLVKQVWAIAEHENDKDTIHKMSDLSFFLKTLKPQPKQEWSEEDKNRMDNLCHFLEEYGDQYYGGLTLKGIINWLKSLRPQTTWKPSEEQIKVCKEVYADILSAKGLDLGTINSELNRMEEELKKLREV